MSEATTFPVINLPTPLIMTVGGQRYRLLPETTAGQVFMGDGTSVDVRIRTLEKVLAGENAVLDTAFTTADGEVPEALRDGGLLVVLKDDDGCGCGCDRC